MRSEILEINIINENECSVVYKVLNKRKNVIYKKNSKKLLSCIDNYLNDLENKKKKVEKQNNNQLLNKQILTYVFIVPIILFIVYILLNYCFGDNKIVNTLCYVGCLLLITCSFLFANLINYKSNLLLVSEFENIEKEIRLINDLKDNCLLYKKSL